jgi:hypothetical protein
MIASNVQQRIDAEVDSFFEMIVQGHWTLQHAHDVLKNPDEYRLDLFKIAALAKAIAICQCADQQGIDY